MTVDPSKLTSEAAAISVKSPAIRTFSVDAAANIVDLADRVAALEKTQHTAQFVPAPPVGPFTAFSTMQWDYDVAHPSVISGVSVDTTDPNAFGIMGYFPAVGRPQPSPSPFTVHDLIAVCRSPYDPSGTHGAGIWIGTWVTAQRLQGSGPNEGVWTGCNCSGSTIVDFTATSVNRAVYIEHRTDHTLFKNFDANGVNGGFYAEDWYGGDGSSYLTFETGRVYCPLAAGGSEIAGIFLDAGTFGCKIADTGEPITFYGPGDAIGLPANLAGPALNVVNQANCVFLNAGRQVFTHNNPIG